MRNNNNKRYKCVKKKVEEEYKSTLEKLQKVRKR